MLSSFQSKKKPVQQRSKHKAKKAHEVKVNNSEEEEYDFDVLITDEVTVRNISSASEPNAVQVNETTVKQEIILFDNKLGAYTEYGVIKIPTKKRQVRVRGKIDTGVQVNLINYTMFTDLFCRNCDKLLQMSTVKLNGYGGYTFKNYRTFTVDVFHGVCICKLAKFFVTSFGNNLFSMRLCKGLKMIKINCAENGCKECDCEYDICKAVSTQSIPSIKTREDLIQAHPMVYDGEIGLIKGYKYHLEL